MSSNNSPPVTLQKALVTVCVHAYANRLIKLTNQISNSENFPQQCCRGVGLDKAKNMLKRLNSIMSVPCATTTYQYSDVSAACICALLFPISGNLATENAIRVNYSVRTETNKFIINSFIIYSVYK